MGYTEENYLTSIHFSSGQTDVKREWWMAEEKLISLMRISSNVGLPEKSSKIQKNSGKMFYHGSRCAAVSVLLWMAYLGQVDALMCCFVPKNI